MQSTMGVICLISGFMSAMLLQTNAALTLKNRASFYRETASNTYNSVLFPLIDLLSEIPWVALFSIAVRSIAAVAAAAAAAVAVAVAVLSLWALCSQGIPIAYFLIGFSTDASRFFLFWFTSFMLAMVGISLAILLAVALPNFEVVSILVGVSQVSD